MLIVFLRLFISTMGVTLERVQNKFACIIGELTNEPLVLSQFAIWVDLRISEYKSKGTISLDCSGESPDPSWLKGHINPPLHSLPSSLTGHGGVHNSFTQKARLPSRDSSRLYQNNRSVETVEGVEYVSDRLSPEVQAIKEEMSEGIYPVSVHKHDGAGTRKRTAESFQSSDQSLYSQSEGSFFPGQNSSNTFTGGTPKARRVEAAGDDNSAVESPSNQSFMSVIGDSFQETDDPSQSDASLLEEQSRGGNLASRFSAANAPASMSSPSTSDGARPGTSGSAASVRVVVVGPTEGMHGLETGMNIQTTEMMSAILVPERLRNKNIRARIRNVEQKSVPTIGNIVNSVGILERWIWKEYGDRRNIEAMPPEELDSYLTEFFPTLKKPNGEDYDADSWTNFRSYLDRFLKEHNYPCSISKSVTFAESQRVFKTKRKWLSEKRKKRLKSALSDSNKPSEHSKGDSSNQ